MKSSFRRSSMALLTTFCLLIVPALGLTLAGWYLNTDRPLGIPAEWAWHRIHQAFDWQRAIPAMVVLGLYLAIVWFGYQTLRHQSQWWLIALMPTLLLAGLIVQATLIDTPAPPFGAERWPIAISNKSVSGYYEIGSTITDPILFLRQYKSWVDKQDNFHVGTHPPGLFIYFHLLDRWFAQRPGDYEYIAKFQPKRFAQGMKEAVAVDGKPLTVKEKGVLWSASAITWLLCILTALPIYGLARVGTAPEWAWMAAASWLVVPAPILFYPLADAMFAPLSATIIYLMMLSYTSKHGIWAALAGLLWFLSTSFSLAFLALLPIIVGVGLLGMVARRGCHFVRWIINVLAFVAGAAIPAELLWHFWHVDVVAIAQINLSKHAGFYTKFPRTYDLWVWVDLLEFAVVVGPALIACAILAMFAFWPNQIASPDDEVTVGEPAVGGQPTWLGILLFCWLATIGLLDYSGKNLAEVARLWIFLTPFASVAMGAAGQWFGQQKPFGMIIIVMQWITCLLLLSHVEPLLPVPIGK